MPVPPIVRHPSKRSQPESIHTLQSIHTTPSPTGNSRVQSALPSPTTATEALPRWNHPRSNMFRVFATFWSFLVMGANDAAYGVCKPTVIIQKGH
jgi:hypothetical protein